MQHVFFSVAKSKNIYIYLPVLKKHLGVGMAAEVYFGMSSSITIGHCPPLSQH